jgi:hypothetical protein
MSLAGRRGKVRKWQVTFQNDEVAQVTAATYAKARSAARLLNYTGIHSVVLMSDARADRKQAIAAYRQMVAA